MTQQLRYLQSLRHGPLALTVLLLPWLVLSVHAQATMKTDQVSSLASVLDANGHVQSGAEGSFDGAGFRMTYAEDGAPRFLPAVPMLTDQWSTDFSSTNGLNNSVSAIAVSGSDIYVGGNFTNAGGNPNADRIARWDGSNWNALGTGINNFVFAIAVSGSDVYVGGLFSIAGGIFASNIARWDGATWHALGSGLNNTVFALATSGSDVYAAGQFTDAGGNGNADRIARWDGSSWNALGTGACCGGVQALAISGNDVYIGGIITNVGGNPNADNIARWDGTQWNALSTGINNPVSVIAANGSDVYVGGSFVNIGGDPNADFILRWDGTAWNALGTGLNSIVSALAIIGNTVYAGGNFTNAGGHADADRIARWDGTAWSVLGTGLNNHVGAVAIAGAHIWAGGSFTATGNGATASLRIGRYEDSLLPVELTAFDAVLDGRTARLTWTTASETNNAGFLVMQQEGDTGAPIRSWQEIGWVDGHGTTEVERTYHFQIDDLPPGRHRFRLKQIDYDGTFAYSPEVEVAIDLPDTYLLTDPYPNPFADHLQLSLMVKRTQRVQVGLYNMLGQQVVIIHQGLLTAEMARSFSVGSAGLPSGLYVLRVEGEHFIATRPVTLVR